MIPLRPIRRHQLLIPGRTPSSVSRRSSRPARRPSLPLLQRISRLLSVGRRSPGLSAKLPTRISCEPRHSSVISLTRLLQLPVRRPRPEPSSMPRLKLRLTELPPPCNWELMPPLDHQLSLLPEPELFLLLLSSPRPALRSNRSSTMPDRSGLTIT